MSHLFYPVFPPFLQIQECREIAASRRQRQSGGDAQENVSSEGTDAADDGIISSADPKALSRAGVRPHEAEDDEDDTVIGPAASRVRGIADSPEINGDESDSATASAKELQDAQAAALRPGASKADQVSNEDAEQRTLETAQASKGNTLQGAVPDSAAAAAAEDNASTSVTASAATAAPVEEDSTPAKPAPGALALKGRFWRVKLVFWFLTNLFSGLAASQC